jgi:MFS family permease
VGDGLRTIALPLLVFKITGSALNLGVTYALEWWSFGIFSLVGGSLADRVNRKTLMIACDVLRSAIILAFALGYRAGWLTLPLLYAGIVLHASCGAVFNGGQASSIPYVVGKARATRAVAVLSGTESAVGTVSTPLGGALFGLMGPLPALLVNAVTYLASVASLGTIRDLGPEQTSGLPRFRHIAGDVRIGFRFLFADRAMRLISLASLFGNFLGMMEYTALVPLIKRNLGGSDFSVGIAFGALGAGSVVGAVLAPRLHASFGKIVVAAYVLGWIAYLPIAWTQSFTVLTIALFLSAIPGAAYLAHVLGWRMRVIPEETVGRVFGAVRLLVLFGLMPGALMGGAVADAFGARTAIVAALAGSLCSVVFVCFNRTIREESR